MFTELAKEKNIQFILEDKFKDTFYGDKDKISQILTVYIFTRRKSSLKEYYRSNESP